MSVGAPIPRPDLYTLHNTVELVRGGRQYFDLMVDLIRNAQRSIHLQVYIFDEDETGTMVAEALKSAVGRNVPVFLLVDGYASQRLSKSFIANLKDSGVQFRWFEPLFQSPYFYFGRRLHHKVLVVDETHCLVGGINISNRYNDFPGQPAWLDWAIHASGEIGKPLFYFCQDIWNKSGWGKKKFLRFNLEPSTEGAPVEKAVRLRRQDWVRRRTEISRSYIEMLDQAKDHVIIMSSYLLPGRVMRKRLAAAAERGVQIKIIAAGKSDVMLAKHAERFLYRWLLKNRIELYEYRPSVLHGKISTYDGKWVSAGSYNLNYISAYASIELNLDVLDTTFARHVEEQLLVVIDKDCHQITAEEFDRSYHWPSRIWQRVSYEIVRLVFYLFTFYFRQR
ncbi:phospholipase D-like domain-containing protein [Flavihumibacter rivuli]|uniref:phospholipase D-like domain-containing protein n=1 Tax=Flavihumibacter rivuli TaxID=2838156 RepID=UPI001BDF35DA|nr:phospholipase D-like domain-containing protein [Flavihumibacter rivuli]ULQ58226.1 phospholipase D-like domain-containing protein [Flavihumibacter rivuli]